MLSGGLGVSAVSKITTKGQTTIPREIRDVLHAGPGDLVSWDVTEEGKVEVHRVMPMDIEYLRAVQATLCEWDTPEDDEAYKNL